MPPLPLKRAKATSISTPEPVLGLIASTISIESDSDLDSGQSEFESLPVEGSGNHSSSSDSNDLDGVVIQNAPPSPPPTVSKRKCGKRRGRKSKRVEEVDISGL